MQRKKIVLSITLALGLAQNPAHAQFNPVIQLSDLDGSNGFRLNGEADHQSGRSVNTAGDINSDGIDDLIVGTLFGTSYVVFGTNNPFNTTINLSSLDGSNGFLIDAPSNNGSPAGDINGDGIDDLIIGSYQENSSYVVFGKSAPFNSTLILKTLDGTNGFRLNGVAEYDQSGFAVSAAGDVNGDGFDDLIIGAFGADPNGSRSGSSYVVFGKSTPFASTQSLSTLDGSNGFRLDGEGINHNSGFAVSAAGDVNGDGFDDLIIGAYSASPNGTLSGSSYVMFGSSSPFNATMNLSSLVGSNGFRLDGEVSSRSGQAVSFAGDINDDGFDDLFIGAPHAFPNGFYSGSSYVVFGSSSPFNAIMNLSSLDGNNGFRLDGLAANYLLGRSVSAAGDINGDGIDDLILGAIGANANGNTSSGSSFVIYGTNTPFTPTVNLSTLDSSSGFRIDGVANNDQSGFAVNTAGDVNGDGIDDLIVGAPYTDSNGNQSGSSYVVFGKIGAPLVSFDLNLVDFGDTILGTSSDIRTVTLNNSGNGPAVIIDNITLDDPAFAITGGQCGTLPIIIGLNETCTLDLQFTPQAVGTNTSPVIINSNSASSPNSFTLSGNGILTPIVSLQPDPLVFSETPLGNSTTETLTVENTGASTLEINGLFFQGANNLDFNITSINCMELQLEPNQTCDIEMSFTPTAVGTREAMLRLESNALNSPDFLELRGSAPTPPPIVSLQPDRLVYIDTPLGSAITATITVQNFGPSTLEPTAVTIQATGTTNFFITMNNCQGAQLKTNQFCDIQVSFAPSAVGSHGALLQLESNAPSSPDFVTLSGNGVLPPVVSLQPDPLVFMDTPVGNSITETLTVENIGPSNLEPGMVSIQGTDAADFSIAMNNCQGAQLTTNQSCDIEVSFTPTIAGTRAAMLQLESNAPSSPDFIELIGSSDVIFKNGFE